jgi:hypothetical protein
MFAIDPTSKLIPSFLTGPRDLATATTFARDLHARIIGKPQISVDGWPHWQDAFLTAFGWAGCNLGACVKEYQTDADPRDPDRKYTPSRVKSIEKRPLLGAPHEAAISTAIAERMNLTGRMQQRRLTRLTNAYSKKRENLVAAIGLHFMHYNFVRMHEALGTTPAVAAGLAAAPWSIGDLVEAALRVAARLLRPCRPLRPPPNPPRNWSGWAGGTRRTTTRVPPQSAMRSSWSRTKRRRPPCGIRLRGARGWRCKRRCGGSALPPRGGRGQRGARSGETGTDHRRKNADGAGHQRRTLRRGIRGGEAHLHGTRGEQDPSGARGEAGNGPRRGARDGDATGTDVEGRSSGVGERQVLVRRIHVDSICANGRKTTLPFRLTSPHTMWHPTLV